MAEKTNTAPGAAVPKKQKLRSPNYPLVGLERAVELATAMHQQYGTHPAPLKLLHKLWNVAEGSNTGNQWVAALSSYGLIDVTGEGENRKAAVSPNGIRIVRNAPDRLQLLKDAALKPGIHSEIVKHYGEAGLPADALLEQYLVWDRPEGKRFNPDTVKKFIARFRATLAFAGGVSGDKIADEDGEDNTDNDKTEDHPPPPPKQKERRRMVQEGAQEFAFELEEGPAVLTLPQGIGAGSTEDLEDWLKLVVRKIKRSTKSAASTAEQEPDEEDQDDE